MRKIKYYDRFSHHLLEIEVTDEVAKFHHADNRRLSRKGQIDRECMAISLDEFTNHNGEDWHQYHELIPDPNADIDKIMERKELKRVVWGVVDKLPPEERLIIRDFYKIGHRPFEIAEKLKINGPKFSQRKATALKHLRNLLLFSKEFVQTDYFMNSDFQPFPNEIVEEAKQIDYNTFKVSQKEVHELTKQVPQEFKIIDKLEIETIDQDKELGLLIHKEVRNFLNWVEYNGGELGNKTIPEMLPDLVKYTAETSNPEKDKRLFSTLKKTSPNLFGLENNVDWLVDTIKNLLGNDDDEPNKKAQ